jgi:hypothetical protein
MFLEILKQRRIALRGEQHEFQRLRIQTLFPDHLERARDPFTLAKIAFHHAFVVIFLLASLRLRRNPQPKEGSGFARPSP